MSGGRRETSVLIDIFLGIMDLWIYPVLGIAGASILIIMGALAGDWGLMYLGILALVLIVLFIVAAAHIYAESLSEEWRRKGGPQDIPPPDPDGGAIQSHVGQFAPPPQPPQPRVWPTRYTPPAPAVEPGLCASCGGTLFVGRDHCPHCGTRVARSWPVNHPPRG